MSSVEPKQIQHTRQLSTEHFLVKKIAESGFSNKNAVKVLYLYEVD